MLSAIVQKIINILQTFFKVFQVLYFSKVFKNFHDFLKLLKRLKVEPYCAKNFKVYLAHSFI